MKLLWILSVQSSGARPVTSEWWRAFAVDFSIS